MFKSLALVVTCALLAPASGFFRKIGGGGGPPGGFGGGFGGATSVSHVNAATTGLDEPRADDRRELRVSRPKTPSPRRAGNVFPTPGEETGFFFMLPKKKNSATQNEKTTLKTKKNRKAEKHLKLGLPALKLAIAQNPIKGFFKAFFDFSPAEGSITCAENTVSTRK